MESVQALRKERIRAMFRQTYQRDPKDWELDSAELFITNLSRMRPLRSPRPGVAGLNEMMFID